MAIRLRAVRNSNKRVYCTEYFTRVPNWSSKLFTQYVRILGMLQVFCKALTLLQIPWRMFVLLQHIELNWTQGLCAFTPVNIIEARKSWDSSVMSAEIMSGGLLHQCFTSDLTTWPWSLITSTNEILSTLTLRLFSTGDMDRIVLRVPAMVKLASTAD